MNKHKKRVIKGEEIRSDEAVNHIFRTLMDFPDWEDERAEEWIDMISLTSPTNQTIPHFRAQEPEQFELEIHGTDLAHINPQQMTNLVRRVAMINKRYQARTGRSIISLIVT